MDSAPSRSASRRALRAASSSESLGNDGEVGTGDRIVELDENVASLDAIAILHVELADNAAGRMLDFFHVESTTMEPCAMSAPAIGVVAAHPPTPNASRSTIRPPVSRWRWMESRELPGAATGFSRTSQSSVRVGQGQNSL